MTAKSKVLDAFILQYADKLREGAATVLVGSGLSRGAGGKDWAELLTGAAGELGIGTDEDLTDVAQYYVNSKMGNRGQINDLLVNEYAKNMQITENHKILASLPMRTYWTTNYDTLIEKALEAAGRKADVKWSDAQLTSVRPGRDAIVYKMHGHCEAPADIVLLKEDYEMYARKHKVFNERFASELMEKTFLFLGFSLKDPNINRILAEVKADMGKAARQHYALIRKESEDRGKRRQECFVKDMKRLCVDVILIDEYKEITDILKAINDRINGNSVFVSGSAVLYGKGAKAEQERIALEFVQRLGAQLIRSGRRIVSGCGLGISSALICGAMQEIYAKGEIVGNKLDLHPFPHNASGKSLLDERGKQQYREEMISHAGVAVFVFGNKVLHTGVSATSGRVGTLDGKGVYMADGMLAECKIAREQGCLIVPVGVTGYAAKAIWDEANKDFSQYYAKWLDGISDAERRKRHEAFARLNSGDELDDGLIKVVLDFMDMMCRV